MEKAIKFDQILLTWDRYNTKNILHKHTGKTGFYICRELSSAQNIIII